METKTEILIKLFGCLGTYSVNQIKDILIHEDCPPNTWGLLCQIIVAAGRYLYRDPYQALAQRAELLKDGFPATADEGGIDYWMAIEIISLFDKNISPKIPSLLLRNYKFDYESSYKALNHFFTLVLITSPNKGICIDDTNQGQIEFIYWE